MQEFPKNKLAQLIVKSCENYSINTVVISPGSRNAPLIIGFNGSKNSKILSVVDERSAAFFALGIAQQTRNPVALVCTSGSALLNYYPAIAEAFYSNIPLVVISADRPAHLIDVGDGQTIRQENVFENHILFSANLGCGNDRELIEKALQTAINKKGPVHINVPFEDPLYEKITAEAIEDAIEKLKSQSVKIEEKSLLKEIPLEVESLQKFADLWNASAKKMVLVGEHFPDELLQIQLEHFVKDPSVLVLIENTANVSHPKFINSIDKLIFPFGEDELEEFKPDILLTLGGMIVSKKIKEQLRNYKPKHHWHADALRAYDTFHCLEHHFKVSPQLFFSQFFFLTKKRESNYQHFWLHKKEFRLQKHQEYMETCPFSDLKVFNIIMAAIPDHTQLQLGNSSVIRYAQLFDSNKTWRIFCNRGTSGIDGCTSTAIGAAYAVKENTLFISGDISFIYDSNALWNNYIPNNFRIIVINNGGGGIFRFIPGPKQSDALVYFETPHHLTAEHLCKMYHFEYSAANDEAELQKQLANFYEAASHPKVLEIFTPRLENDDILKAYFNNLKA
ncbi:MAG: 2-succinyl-5-enolpyruvyl-6-hydroxy-3-cyclohexene-1-carboxylic-acid synthase [Flavobacteria bacterium RIFCSPLOWO2_12_FULL_35_11]|nr:MAG: 2-succinyl-5-enolpyruvyl-6-hydroxy-3-cyclohexene-1-carboxylic-acid synthase [Flavobacteria bacterium RIFCSPLOWO2_12_FULL_35_11]